MSQLSYPKPRRTQVHVRILEHDENRLHHSGWIRLSGLGSGLMKSAFVSSSIRHIRGLD
jgi:hypothetical protein